MEVYHLMDFKDKLTEKNIKQLNELVYDHKYDPDIPNQYIGIINNKVVIYCIIKKSLCLYDKKLKYVKNKYNSIRLGDLKDKIIRNDFSIQELNCLYNLKRNPKKKYKGIGIEFIIKLNKLLNEQINLSATEIALYNYYIKNNFKKTNYFDIDTINNNYLRRVIYL